MNKKAAELNLKSSQTATEWIDQLKTVALNDSELNNVAHDHQALPEIVIARLPDMSDPAPRQSSIAINAVTRGSPQNPGSTEQRMRSDAQCMTNNAQPASLPLEPADFHIAARENESIAKQVAQEMDRGISVGIQQLRRPAVTVATESPTEQEQRVAEMAARIAAARASSAEAALGAASIGGVSIENTANDQAERFYQPDMTPPAISADLAASPDTWQDPSRDLDSDRGVSDQPGSNTSDAKDVSDSASEQIVNVDEAAIDKLVETIVERFPATAPAILMFTGTEDNPHCEETCAQVALRLAQRNTGKVLLVDSDTECGKLSRAGGDDVPCGLTTWLSRDVNWQDLISRRSSVGLEFMPVGNAAIKFWKGAQQKVLPLISEFKKEYQYVCVSAGEAHSKSTSLWASSADGTYLIVSMTFSSQTVALSATHYLKDIGARVMGCVVTETDI